MHATLSLVVSKVVVAGERLTLTGGNVLGVLRPSESGMILIGHGVLLSAGAVILGPIGVGNGAVVGAQGLVITDGADGAVMVGVTARQVRRNVENVDS